MAGEEDDALRWTNDAAVARLLAERQRLRNLLARNAAFFAAWGADMDAIDESLPRPQAKQGRGRRRDTDATMITRAILDYAQAHRRPPTKTEVAGIINRDEDTIDTCLRREACAGWQDWCDDVVRMVGVQPRNRSS